MSQTMQKSQTLEESSNPLPPKEANGTVDCQKRCKEFAAELAKTKMERDQYRKAVLALTRSDFEIHEAELNSQAGKGPSLKEIIANLEH